MAELPVPNQVVYVAEIPESLESIDSERLLLRPIGLEDAAAILAIRSRPEVAKNNHPKAPFKSLDDVHEWMASKIYSQGPAELLGRTFNFGILDKSIPQSQEQLIGYVGVNCLVPCPMLGYSLLPEAWGNGFATEALQLVIKKWWELPRRAASDQTDGPERIYAICEKVNLGSSGVLRKCGFELVAEGFFEADELQLWGLEKPPS
ncbi:Carboxypeptidase cpdS [Penicillium diatomitis]|uniref:Carboxypeptidase cpdS n=1 Tax=Penicillium diatomitis TaxID=2819901 RepID=A0A9W9XFC3_9EURO|nr:Carboxypeptidase cpdS [Penicillium diatomitis]KAJ5490703.1 Carboxypeptidase cpdS [Penicillium diatomitis]